MLDHLRRMPAPVWTMVAWSSVVLLNAIVLLIFRDEDSGAGVVVAWGVVAAFNLIVVVACVSLSDRTPDRFLQTVLAARLGLLVLLAAANGGAGGQSIEIVSAVMVVIYAALWWRGWLPYGYTAAASFSLLIAESVTGGVRMAAWLATTSLLFTIAIGMTYFSRRLRKPG